ncbi:TPA: hypothetical protein PXJ37_002729 [Yersinia enterocolitica]|nr:hypothetical protein [Yersinia enterocolitica]HDL6613139.1 hypothetical protein [Yersinia enterocolitica]HDL7764241.1 hypothetical protein [Yersinia enterocolitica]HDM8322199.1 hypothetical protein [Yersinia enterocolitica]HDY4928303.1 hypothetical protein [Yersinia enterocolitica]
MDGGISSLVVAVIGAAAAGLGLVISKENKISEFRQTWIDGLRSDLSELMTSHYQRYDEDDPKIINQSIDKINLFSSNIRLRLSSDKPTKYEKALLDLIAIEMLGKSPQLPAVVMQKRYYSYSSKVLKAEWKRVKKGEKTYRVCSFISGGTLLFCATLLIIYLINHWDIFWRLLTA